MTKSGSSLYAVVSAAKFARVPTVPQAFSPASVADLWDSGTIYNVATCATCAGWVHDAFMI